MSALMVSISGVRGVVGATLTPQVVLKYVGAFATLQKGKTFIIGRDSRVSGPWVLHIVHGALMAMGYHVIDIGIVPTPTVQYIVEKYKADGGIIVTSSHNPVQWNGLKFVDRDGCFLAPNLCEQMFALADKGVDTFSFAEWQTLGKIEHVDTAGQEHIDSILRLSFVDVDLIKSKKFKVCLDSVNGAGGPIMTSLLTQLGCEVVGMNIEQTGVFAHPPEPVPAHLDDLCKAVVKHGANLGIAVDPDVDRCVLIDEKGVPLGEEYTLGLAVQLIIGVLGKRGAVCKNLSSSRVVDDVATKHGCAVYATPVGEIHVAKKMIEVGAIIGGEGNGGVMLPDVHIGRDALVAAALTLQHLAVYLGSNEHGTISSLKASLPQYQIVKLSCPVSGIDVSAVFAHFKQKYGGQPGITLNEEDGLRIDIVSEGKAKWVHMRKSNTEPIVRVIGEAETAEAATEMCQDFMKQIKEYQ